eukprot:13445942-Alexandrium_andersonii.AAC.1
MAAADGLADWLPVGRPLLGRFDPRRVCDPAGTGLLGKVGRQAVFAPGEAGVGGRRCGKGGTDRRGRASATAPRVGQTVGVGA